MKRKRPFLSRPCRRSLFTRAKFEALRIGGHVSQRKRLIDGKVNQSLSLDLFRCPVQAPSIVESVHHHDRASGHTST